MAGEIKKIAIVGGGTAGWLVANHLGKALRERSDIALTLIESPSIPAIGVGEGTVPMMRDTLRYFEISERQFIAECDATFKQSVKFINWLDKDTYGEGNFYHHLFEYPFPADIDMSNFWLHSKKQQSYAEYASFQQAVCEAGLAPKRHDSAEFEGVVAYAYHLDAKKFGQLLQRNAVERFGVKHYYANVEQVTLDAEGYIESLLTSAGESLEFDFYIDCSGFSSLLLGKTLNVPFTDKTNELFVDTALTLQVPVSEQEPLPPYTLATAHKAGWCWDISLPERRGVGLVYSSKYMTDDEAVSELESYLKAKPGSVHARKIPMPVGYRESFWEKNCVAIGLSQGFVEPLEATAILVSDFCARLFSERVPVHRNQLPVLSRVFNKRVRYAWDRVIDFIKLHYCLSDRNDSDFWIDNRDPATISEHLKDLLQQWSYSAPKKSDFFSKFEVFDIENYLYVLYGMRYPTQASGLDSAYQKAASELLGQIQTYGQRAADHLPQHRELINALRRC